MDLKYNNNNNNSALSQSRRNNLTRLDRAYTGRIPNAAKFRCYPCLVRHVPLSSYENALALTLRVNVISRLQRGRVVGGSAATTYSHHNTS